MLTDDDRSPLILIKEAELVNSSNDYISNYYVNLSRSAELIDVVDLDCITEHKLLQRNDDFVDIILAQYCFFHETAQKLFAKSFVNNNLTLRLACLANKSFGRKRSVVYNLPMALFENSNIESLRSWFATITLIEINTLFRNETINSGFLVNFLNLEIDLWNVLDEDKKLEVLYSLYYNPIVCKRYQGPMDGYAEYSHGKLFSAIWDLAKILPVEQKWAYALGNLLEKTIDSRFKFDSLDVAKRWDISEPDENKKRFLSGFESVRFAIYQDVIKDVYGTDKTNKLYYSNEDVAYRACAYVHTNMKEDDIQEAYKKDKLIAIEYIMRNLYVWRNVNTRKVLHDICWDADKTINNNYLDCANLFNWQKEELTKSYPNWFVEKVNDWIDEDEKVLNYGLAKELVEDKNAHQSHAIITELNRLKDNFDKKLNFIQTILFVIVSAIIVLYFNN